MNAPGLLMIIVLAAIPPLAEDQRVRLETAYDGRDHREEAFVALVENVETWTEGLADAPVRLSPDFDAMLASPDEYRGELCRVIGVLQQRTRLARPHDRAWEWFIRDDSGRAIMVYVVGLTAEDETAFADGRRVAIVARFYKRVDATARDGRTHSYPALVGAFPRLAGSAASGGADLRGLFTLAIVLLALAVAVVVLLVVLARRQRAGARTHRPSIHADDKDGEVDAGGPLPDDPAEALAELKRRAEVDSNADDSGNTSDTEL